MKRNEAFPSNFVSKDDLAQPTIATIQTVEKQKLKSEHGEEEKPVMSFADFDKSLVLNNVNWQTCEDAYGDDSDGWRGKRIELYVDPSIMFGNKRVGGVRLRLPQPSRPTSGSNGRLSWDDACRQAGEVGLSVDGLKQALKDRGLNGYSADRDGQLVRDIVSERRKESVFAAPGEVDSGEVNF